MPREFLEKSQANQLTEGEIAAARDAFKVNLRAALRPDPELIGEIDAWAAQHPVMTTAPDAEGSQQLHEAIQDALSVTRNGVPDADDATDTRE